MGELGHWRDFPTDELGERAAAWLALPGDQRVGPDTRLAATVMLLRDRVNDPQRDGLEVFLLRRVPSMAFAPRMTVFPGGGVDLRDRHAVDLPWVGPGPAEWAERLGCGESDARGLVVAAVREVFEECGVLLAGSGADDVVADVADDSYRADRAALEARELSFAEMLARRGLVLRADLLSLRGRWITPPFESRRYDTAFFAALLPSGQHPDDCTTETDLAGWYAPADVLAAHERGEVRMLPPTIVSLEELADADADAGTDSGAAAAVVAQQPPVWPIEPELVPGRDGTDPVLRARVPRTSRGADADAQAGTGEHGVVAR